MADRKELERVQEELEKMYLGQVIEDGIVNMAKFEATTCKILWVLKEPNDPHKGKWSLLEFMSSRDSLAKGYNNWRRTYKLIIKSSYAILKGVTDQNQIPSEWDAADILSSIAFINISKVGGPAVSYHKGIDEHFKNNAELLLRQVKAIGPDLIINCSRNKGIEALLKAKDYKNIGKFYVANTNVGRLIGAYHPAARISHAEYLSTMLDCARSLNFCK